MESTIISFLLFITLPFIVLQVVAFLTELYLLNERCQLIKEHNDMVVLDQEEEEKILTPVAFLYE